jgi:CHAT domain
LEVAAVSEVTMLDKNAVDDLLGLVDSDDVQMSALPVLQCIVQFGIEPSALPEVGERVLAHLNVRVDAEDRADYLEAMRRLPTPAATQRLREIAGDPSDPGSLDAAKLLGAQPGTRDDPVAPHLPGLLERAEHADAEALRELACLPLENYDVSPAHFSSAIASPDITTRFWGAAAVARLGETRPLLDVIEQLDVYSAPWLASPWPLRALPVVVVRALRSLDMEEFDGGQRRVVEWLTRDRVRPSAPAAATTRRLSDAEAAAVLDEVRHSTSRPQDGPPEEAVDQAELLTAEQQGEVVTRLVEATMSQDDWGRVSWGNATMTALGSRPSIHVDVDRIVTSFVQSDGPGMDLRQLGAVLSRADENHVVHVVVKAMREAPTRQTNGLAELLESTSRGRAVYIGADPDVSDDFDTNDAAAPELDAPEAPATTTYTAYPRIDVDNPVVVLDQPFTAIVGLSERPRPGVESPGALALPVSAYPIDDLEVEVVVDPQSIEVVGGERVFQLVVTGPDSFPTVKVQLCARYYPGVQADRRITLLFRRAGRVVGFAFRLVTAVESEAQRNQTPAPNAPEGDLLDLSPLVDSGPPDLLLCLFRSDKPDEYVWGVYPCEGTVTDLASEGTPLTNARDFALYANRKVKTKEFRGQSIFDELVGYGRTITSCLPQVVIDAIRATLADATEQAPSILLLTQDPYVPWELAVPPAQAPAWGSVHGGTTPFLGAHAAISRWPISENQKPRLTRWPSLAVARQAAITADYTGVQFWPALNHAREEAANLAATYGMSEVTGSEATIRACLNAETPYEVLHLALHGQHDPEGLKDGLVLVGTDEKGRPAAVFFSSGRVLGLDNTAAHSFVFLNACQVASGENVLGGYAGFATNLLAIGATAVVAPLWNVDDDVAAGITARFYAQAYAEPAVPIAEILRRERASYTPERVQSGDALATPTLIAYQCFGHPHFTLHRTPA